MKYAKVYDKVAFKVSVNDVMKLYSLVEMAV